MVETSRPSTTHSGSTFVNRAIFSRTSFDSGRSERQMSMSGWIPSSSRALTLCCVGFVLISPADVMYGTSVTWMAMALVRPSMNINWRMASRNGRLSMSPTVPPTSVMTTSYSPLSPIFWNRRLISSVMCGMTCTVAPR